MAKRKSNKKKTRRKKGKSLFSTVKHFVWGLSTAIASLSALLFFFNCYFPIDKTHTQEAPETISVETEYPQLNGKRKEQIINHKGFTLSYNADFRIANWTAYELTAAEVKSRDVKRSNNFFPDPKVKGATATDEDYRRSGYDRGHLVPAADMRWSEEGMQASFYFSNICPQNREMNAGIWNDIEKQCRTWATNHGVIRIVTGPVIRNDMKRLGRNRVGVPEQFYKVVSTTGELPKSIGFLVENREYANRSLRAVAVPVDSIERVAGIRFFPSFPAGIQKEIVSAIDLSFWKFNKRD